MYTVAAVTSKSGLHRKTNRLADHGMPRQEDDLLARLNALKPSSVTLESETDLTDDVGTPKSSSVSDRLAERLKGLRAGDAGPAKADDDILLPSRAPQRSHKVESRPTQPDRIHETDHSENEEQSLEDLLEELGPDDQWKLDPNDSKHINSLLDEARAALPSEPQENASPDERRADHSDQPQASADGHESEASDPEKDGRKDDEEADDYVKRVLAELEYEKKYGIEDDEEESQPTTEHQSTEGGLELPSTPSNALQKAASSSAEPPSYEDSELEARFSKLGGLNLPSTPTTSPSVQANAAANAGAASLKKAKAKSNLPTYTDEDIDSWCCICNEDGELKCLGCDGDIYCQVCWNEGHGSAPGQERGHKAVQFVRKGPAAAAA